MLRKLIDLQYARNDIDFKRSTFRVRGDVVELHPSYEEFAYRIELFGDEITAIDAVNPLTGEMLSSEQQIFIYPAVHYVMPEERVARRRRNPSARNWTSRSCTSAARESCSKPSGCSPAPNTIWR